MKKGLLASLGLVLCLNIGLAEGETKKNTRIVCQNEEIEKMFKNQTKEVYSIIEGADRIVCEWLDTKGFPVKCVMPITRYGNFGIASILKFDDRGIDDDYRDGINDTSIFDALNEDFLPIVEKHYSAFLKKKFEEGKCKEIKLGD